MATDKELEQQLVEAGNKLVDPPASVDSLLQVLDQLENCLSKVEQSPSELMHDALGPSLKSLVEDQFFKHSNADVRVAVTSCISEITRITAPDAPYDDDQMKDVFKLIVSSFEKLADNSSRSYGKRISILETVAKVRSCVVMLDLECDELIAEMFQHFLNGIRDYHPESVFSSMETIMTLVLEESEDISVELIYPLLDSVKKENEKLGEKVLGSSSAKVLPVARRLAEKVLESCAAKVKPFLTNAVKSMEISLNNYSGTVAAICEEISGTIGQNDVHAADENKIGDSKHVSASAEDAAQAVDEAATEAPSPKKADETDPTNNSSPKLGMSNGVGQPGEDDSLGDSNSSKKEEDGHYTEHSKSLDGSNNNQTKTLDAEKVVNSENMTEEPTENKETKVSSMEPVEPPKNSDIDTDTVMETVPNDKAPSEDIPSSPNKNPPEEADVSSVNKNETGSRPSSPKVLEGESVTDASPSVSGSLNEELPSEKSERTRKKDILVEDPVLSADDVPQKAFDGTTNSEVRPNKHAGRKPPPRISVEDVVPSTADASSKENSSTTEMEEKSWKNLPRKVDASSKNEDGSSLQQSEDKGRRGRGKTVSGRKTKSTTKVDEKVKVASPKSAPKPTIDEPHLETPLTNGKRKRAPVREKVSDAEEYSENVVGAKVKVYWPKDRQYYEGIIESFDPAKKKHKVVYLDGDEEVLNLKRERMQFIADGPKSDEEEVAEQSIDDTSSEMPLKKKMKGNPDCSTKQGKMDDSSLKRSGGTSAGKSRSAGFQSGQKSKSLGKTDGKSVGDLKAVKKREDDNGRKVNHRTSKSGGKSADVASKSTSKSRNEAEPLVISKAELKCKQALRKNAKSGGFESLNLNPNVFRGIRRKGYRVPTPIQRKTMPLILSGADVVAMARTGSGKTAAFLVPMLEKLQQHVPQGGVRALILSPTRDLALQTLKFTKELGKFTDLRTSLLVGGDSMESQFEELAQNPDIIIATPGRLMHHLTEVEDMSLKTVEYVVFDEADSLFGMGFAEQLHKILTQLSENRQTLLFSATLPSALAEFAKAGLRDPQLVRLDLDTKVSPDLKTVFFTLRHEEKYPALLYLIREHISSDQQTLIFVSTKHHVEFLNILFKEEGIEPSVCYGDMDQDARKIHISRFRARKTMLLIVTDVAARGIDIPLLDNVINWDFPPKPKIFVHRVGRAARAGRTGTAFSFVTPEDMPYLLDLHLFLSKPIRAAPTEEEVLQDMDGVMNKIDQAIANGETIYGRFPQSVLDLVSDRIREIIDSSAELSALQKTCKNAFRLYMKTKPAPAKESIKRVKDLPREGLHPIFKHVLGDGELVALAFSERLKAFRPKQTILEAEGEAAKSKNLQGPLSQWTDVMKKKRAVHENVINMVHQQRTDKREEKEVQPEIPSITKEKKASGLKRKAQSFKDEEFYISPVPSNHHTEAGLSVRGNEGFGSNRLETAVLDLVADNSEGMQKQKASYHWDKRSKKYVKLNNGERVTASGKVKTESGAKVKANKTGIYEKWKQRSHRKVSLRGTGDGETAEETAGTSGGRHFGRNNRKFGGRQQRSVPNANVRSEIKDFDQVRKERQKKADRMSSMKNKNGKGKKFGKNGKRGKPRK